MYDSWPQNRTATFRTKLMNPTKIEPPAITYK